MAIRSRNLTATYRYVSNLDADKGNPEAETVWILGTLDSRVVGHLRDIATVMIADEQAPNGQAVSIRNGKVNYEGVAFGLKGFERFYDCDGNEHVYKTVRRNLHGTSYDVLSDELLRNIDPAIITELAEQIAMNNTLRVDEGKN
jgi:hypothetical protein